MIVWLIIALLGLYASLLVAWALWPESEHDFDPDFVEPYRDRDYDDWKRS
jgi:hypothetical protein